VDQATSSSRSFGRTVLAPRSHALLRNPTWQRSKSYGLSAWSAHFRVVFFANNETDTRTWLSFQYAKQLRLLKSRCSLVQTYRQLRLRGKWPHAFVGEQTRCIGPSEAKQKAARSDNSRYRDAKLGLRPYPFQSYGRAKWRERVAPSGAANRHSEQSARTGQTSINSAALLKVALSAKDSLVAFSGFRSNL
jgi:hypothetical protein